MNPLGGRACGNVDNAGGVAGAVGNATSGAGSGSTGAGDAGIIGSGLTVTNSGTISGGLGGDGATRANAVNFTGGSNVLTTNTGGTLIGCISSTGTLTLDQSGVGVSAAYSNISSDASSALIVNAGTNSVTLNCISGTPALTTMSGNTTLTGANYLGTVTNNATLTNSLGAVVYDDLTNAGVTNAGSYNANVAANTGTITNQSTGHRRRHPGNPSRPLPIRLLRRPSGRRRLRALTGHSCRALLLGSRRPSPPSAPIAQPKPRPRRAAVSLWPYSANTQLTLS